MHLHQEAAEQIFCERQLQHTARSRFFFVLSIALCALYLVATAGQVLSSAPPALHQILIGALVTLALAVTCLEIAAGSGNRAR